MTTSAGATTNEPGGHMPKGHSMRGSANDNKSASPSVPKVSQTDSSSSSVMSDSVQVVSFAPPAPYHAKWAYTTTDTLALVLITLVAILVRCYKLSTPDKVVFDEVHFGKFAGKYLNGTYFYDLHPPLAKMMFAAAGKMAGYDGVFDFKSIGLDYIAAGVPYVGMRLMPALLGAVTVPATYVTVRACGYGLDTGVLASLLVCFENGLVTQSRLILLDSPLVFFTVLSLACWAMFWTRQHAQFTPAWWFWLVSTGAMMGCAASCKWVGLFLFPVVGLSTVADLWDKIADRSLTPARWAAHFLARAVGLILVPLAVYLFWFQVHFALLYKTGDAAGMMTTEFQTTLAGGLNVTTDRDVYYGSEIRMRTTNGRNGYLHSHAHAWQHDKGSGQQQVTIYGHADQNNLWIVEPAFNTTADASNGPVPVPKDATIRLRHKTTGKYLHSHDKRPALSSQDTKFELSGYGFDNFAGDSNDNFRIEILHGDKHSEGSDKHVQAIYTRFRLIHSNLHCAVYNSRKKLPKWAFEQIEVNCMRNCMPRMSTWHVEYARLPSSASGASASAEGDLAARPQASYRKLGLWGKIAEYNRLMADSNGSLTGDHPFAARPQHWPWLRRGTAYWGGRGNFIYQHGNPLVWWGALGSVLLFAALRSVLFVLDKRRIRPGLFGQRRKYLSAAGFFVVAWAGHYVPFFLMGRELFVHHYFPALWMAILVLAFTLDLFTAGVPRFARLAAYFAVAAAVLYAFETFSYITYARTWSKDACVRTRWLKTWDFDCEHAFGGVRSTEPPPESTPKAEAAADKVAAVDKVVVDDTVPAAAAVGGGADAVEGAEKARADGGNEEGIPAEIGVPFAEEFNPEEKPEEETSEAAADAVYVKPEYDDPTAIKVAQASPVQAPESVAADIGRKSNQPATGETIDDKKPVGSADDKHVEL
ncbi:hypothetical protein LPJ53_005053 [Coemansia erecta]|uniref:Dolichyl-phosphate-mannose--protein mannosyltransferase n=1 Tax=Coemansia erecta TaxID=147472 RepID=A0A9W7XXP8_9FUNG|nr:hypothetical protein LPJ53_005053 [Coemansia erecta]